MRSWSRAELNAEMGSSKDDTHPGAVCRDPETAIKNYKLEKINDRLQRILKVICLKKTWLHGS